MTRSQEFFAAVLLGLSLLAGHAGAVDRFYISIPGPTLSYVPLYYGHEKGFFTQGWICKSWWCVASSA